MTAPMDDRTRAKLAGIATNCLYQTLRDDPGHHVSSQLSRCIERRAWEMVEYLAPETSQPAIARFGSLLDWLTGNPARGGVGARLDRVLLLLTEPVGGRENAQQCLRLMAAHGVAVPSPVEQIQALGQDLDDEQLEQAIASLRLRLRRSSCRSA